MCCSCWHRQVPVFMNIWAFSLEVSYQFLYITWALIRKKHLLTLIFCSEVPYLIINENRKQYWYSVGVGGFFVSFSFLNNFIFDFIRSPYKTIISFFTIFITIKLMSFSLFPRKCKCECNLMKLQHGQKTLKVHKSAMLMNDFPYF